MSRTILEEYVEDVTKLTNLGRELDLTEDQISQVIEESFKFLESECGYEHEKLHKKCPSAPFLRPMWLFCVLCVFVVISASFYQQTPLPGYRKTINNYIERNVQELIYPGMKLFRQLMLPFVKQFPSLTAWYDETCLVENPYFQVTDMDCWPCENVRSVLNLTGSELKHETCHHGLPFIYKEETIQEVNYEGLRNLYVNNKEMFDRDALRVTSDTGSWQTIADVLDQEHFKGSQFNNTRIVWRLNRLEPIREVRQLFGSPQHQPPYTTGSTPEKYVLLDEPKAGSYQLPTTEGSTVFVVQSSGSRMFVLTPANECKGQCHRVSIVLQPQHILWYNWWYWKVSSVPLFTDDQLSITYIGSFF